MEKTFNLTPLRVFRLISKMDKESGASIASIKYKLTHEGHRKTTGDIRAAIGNAMEAGLVQKTDDDRFTLSLSSGNKKCRASKGRGTARANKRKSGGKRKVGDTNVLI